MSRDRIISQNRSSHSSSTKQGAVNQIPAIAAKRGLRKAFYEINRIHGAVYLFISIAALLLSQFPPVYEWFHDSKLNVSVQRSFSLSPNLPYGFSLSKTYTVTNQGEKMGRINSISLVIIKDGEIIQKVAACKFKLRELGPFGYPRLAEFSPIVLRSEDNWSHRTLFSGSVSVHDMDIVSEIIHQIEDAKADWREDQEQNGKSQEEIDLMDFPVPEELHGRLMKYVKDKVTWLSEGRYKIYEISMTNEGPIAISYAFTVKKHQIYRFGQIVNDLTHNLESDGVSLGSNRELKFELTEEATGIPESLVNDMSESPESGHGSADRVRC